MKKLTLFLLRMKFVQMTQTKNGDHMKWGFKVNFCLNLIDCGVK